MLSIAARSIHGRAARLLLVQGILDHDVRASNGRADGFADLLALAGSDSADPELG